ncbi:MAG TPA: cupin domain-containing protein [Herpetosiphonaceae bacterium]
MRSKANAPHYVWGEQCDGWHLVRAEGLSVIQERMPPGTAEARHRHARARQFFFVLAGAAALEIDGRRHALAPGEGAEVPPGIPHQIFNEADRDLEFLVISQPPSHGDRLPAEENEL